MTRKELLAEAEKCICHDRDDQYGSPEQSFERIAAAWNWYLHCKGTNYVTPKDVGNMMVLFKIARTFGTDKDDNYIDLIGYAACAGEIFGNGNLPTP